MKALREWMRDNEMKREAFARGQKRPILRKTVDQMRDMILAMADVMETVEYMHIICGTPSCTDASQCEMCDTWDDMRKTKAAADEVIKEVTHGTNT